MLFNTLVTLALAASASASTFCRHNGGARGVCVSTSECGRYGGRSQAGHCPGAANIQCCAKDKCGKVTRGRCPGGDNYVWVDVLGRCDYVVSGRCPGGNDNMWIVPYD